jgi:hypothetical protein
LQVYFALPQTRQSTLDRVPRFSISAGSLARSPSVVAVAATHNFALIMSGLKKGMVVRVVESCPE